MNKHCISTIFLYSKFLKIEKLNNLFGLSILAKNMSSTYNPPYGHVHTHI
ncbi:hypothetical protein Hanom_Chr09g00871331 [Helianthus anomalus]